MARRLVAAVCVAAAVCLAAPAAMAIVPTGSIHGSVTDGTNPVQGITVIARPFGGDATQETSTVTDVSGEFTIGLAEDTYRVWFEDRRPAGYLRTEFFSSTAEDVFDMFDAALVPVTSGNTTNIAAEALNGGNGAVTGSVKDGATGIDDEIDTRDDAVDSADCGDGNDHAFVDVAGQFAGQVSDNVAGCESVNSDYTPPPVETPPATGTTPPPATTTPAPVVTPVTSPPPPVVIVAGAFVAKIQQSPKADRVTGSANIPADGTTLQVDLLYNGKLAKVTVVGTLVKKGLKKGTYPFTVKLNKKAAKLARKKGKKGLKLTVKVTIKPPTGSATKKQYKVTVRKGKASACFRIARARAHAAC